jgi:NTE family protein
MKLFRIVIVVTMLCPCLAMPVLRAADDSRPKIGLALSGGGARGGAHVGVLRALEELQIPVDYIAGTSMGAIIGGLYAAGYSAAEIETILAETDWDKGLTDKPARKDRTMRKKELEAQFLIPYRVGFNGGKLQLPLGVIEGQHLDQIFHRMLLPVVGISDFDLLPIPFRAVATDLVTGEEVILSGGSLPDSLRASMSVPGVFSPVRLDDRLLVDGGMANNLPISVVREMGADIVIAVDISTPLLTEEQLTSVLSVTEQLSGFLTRRNTEAQIATLDQQDILIIPELGEFSSGDFEEAVEIVHLGYEATMNSEAQLSSLADENLSALTPIGEQQTPEHVIDFIELDNDSELHDEIIRSRLAIELGKPVDMDALDQSVDRIYSLDVFESVTYDLTENEEGQSGILIHAQPRAWGPNYLQFGLELSNDFSGNSDFKLGAAYTKNALNALGGELRVTGSIGREDEISFDFYQPIDPEANWFVEPEVYWRRENYSLWEGDSNIATLEFDGWGFEFGLGRNWSTTHRLTLEYQLARADADVITGDLDFELDDEVEIGELSLNYVHDSLDSLWFPTEGMFHRLSYIYAADDLGASSDYQQAMGNGTFAFSHSKNSALLNYEFGYSIDDKAPIERWYRLGGFGRLSGLVPNQLTGRQYGVATLAYYRHLKDMKLFKAYAGFTLEAGNVWDYSSDIGFDDLRYSASIFTGAETPIGPVYLALGHSDNGDTAVYFYVGNPFRVNRFD